MPKNYFERHPILTILSFLFFIFLVFDFSLGYFFIDKKEVKKKAPRVQHWYYHHSLAENFNGEDVWGNHTYSLQTNNIGFKSPPLDNPSLNKGKRSILFVGDSFTEGIGVPYADTFVGKIKAKHPEIQISNAGVAGYSPRLYYLKVKYLLEIKKMKIDEIIAFVDLSDVLDEYRYKDFNPKEKEPQESTIRKIKSYLFNHSLTINRLLKVRNEYHNYLVKKEIPRNPNNLKKAEDFLHTDPTVGIRNWTIDEDMFNQWALNGLDMARDNMDSLVELCHAHGIKLSLGIYPWPVQIDRNELRGKHVLAWEAFAKAHDLKLINFFPDFILASEGEDVGQYFIPGDMHWNKNGHQKIANKLIAEYPF